MRINIANDFSKAPGGRYHPVDGNKTGQLFRQTFLERPLKETDEVIEINLDGAVGYPSSFLDEAFAGLVREGYDVDMLKKRLKFVFTEERKKRYVTQIWNDVDSAAGVDVD